MAEQRRIAFVVIYYGRWPFYWPLWVQSVAANPQFDFIVITDLQQPEFTASNVHFVEMGYQELISRISRVTGVSLLAASYHKLCDFRPFFGLAFAQELRGYTHWGYCDTDLVFGNLAPLLEMSEDSSLDLISPWAHTVGHCTLARNKPEVNRIGLAIRGMKERLLEPGSTFMDEGAFAETAHGIGMKVGVVEDVRREWTKPTCFLGATIRPDGRVAGLGEFIAHCSRGRIIVYDRDSSPHEVLYLHYMGMKQKRFWTRFAECRDGEFSVTPYGVIPYLIDPRRIGSWGHKWSCARARLPGIIYRSLRDALPAACLRKAKQLKLMYAR
jgi:hypothetical protein